MIYFALSDTLLSLDVPKVVLQLLATVLVWYSWSLFAQKRVALADELNSIM